MLRLAVMLTVAVQMMMLAPCRADAGADAAVAEYSRWIEQHGCKLHPSLRVHAVRSKKAAQRSPEKATHKSLRWSLVTAPETEGHVEPVFPDDDLLACSSEAILVAPHAMLMEARGEIDAERAPGLGKLEELGFRGEDLLALELLAHKTVGSDSLFETVLNTLPSGTEVNALSMGRAEAAVLQGTSAGARVRQVQAGYAQFVDKVGKHTSTIADAFPFFNGPGLGTSYAGSEEAPAERTEEERLDAANRALTPANLRWAMGAVTTSARMVGTGNPSLPQVPCLVPMVHMLRHSPAVRSQITALSQKIKVTHAGPDLQPKGSTEEVAKPGKEVVMNYMPRQWNADLLAMFGVAATSDVHSVLHVFSAPPPTSTDEAKHAADRSLALMRHLHMDNGLLISPLGLSTTALNVARVRSLANKDFTAEGLRLFAKLNNFRRLDKKYRPNEAMLAKNASFAAGEMAWVMGMEPEGREEVGAGGEKEPVVEGAEVADEPPRRLNPHVGGIKLHVQAEYRAIEGLQTALSQLRKGVFGDMTVGEQRNILSNWKVKKRATWQRPENDPLRNAASEPETIPRNPTSGPRLLREAVRVRLEELRAIDAAIDDAEERLVAVRAGNALSGSAGWSKELIDPSVKRAESAAGDDTAEAEVEVQADGTVESE